MERVTAAVLARTGKVLAVHLAYRSRARQRGQLPGTPSYFLKATSSLSLTDGTVERPVDCELLAFEGEVALVIGTAARRVTVAEAWAHVGWVTAANDWGIYELRAADRGANVRAKSGDGFTPVGPVLLPARELDPAGLRVRTWLNERLVQEDTTGGLLFSLPQLVADLSQLMTLQPGDLILSGTPAGSSVAGPGDVVEVSVDVPGGPSTGRLRSTVVQGTAPWLPGGARPQATDAERAAAYGRPAERPAGAVLTPALRRQLSVLGTASVSAQLHRRGLLHVTLAGLHSTRPGERLVGTARTLRYVPLREDLAPSRTGGYTVQKRLVDALLPGEVLVIEARGDPGAGTIGDVLALRAQVRGAAGIVTDGGVRDLAAVAALPIPTFFAVPHPAVLGRRHVPWEADGTISCGGVTVQPGDIILGDADGVLVLPPAVAQEVADAAREQEHQERFISEMVAAGHPVAELFPLGDGWRAAYERWALTHPRPTGVAPHLSRKDARHG